MKRRKFIDFGLKGLVLIGSQSGLAACATPQRTISTPVHKAAEDLVRIKNIIADKAKPAKWLFTGDSITHGAKHTYGQRGYQEIFAERVRTELGRGRDFVINTAISGHTSRDIKNDFEWRVKQFSPDIISLMIGTNDAATTRDVTLAEYETNLNWLIDHFRQLNAVPVIHTPNTIQYKAPGGDIRSALPKYVDVIYNVAKAKDVVLVDNWKYWSDNKIPAESKGWFADPLHPSGKGHLELARLLFKTIGIFDTKSFTCAGDTKC